MDSRGLLNVYHGGLRAIRKTLCCYRRAAPNKSPLSRSLSRCQRAVNQKDRLHGIRQHGGRVADATSQAAALLTALIIGLRQCGFSRRPNPLL